MEYFNDLNYADGMTLISTNTGTVYTIYRCPEKYQLHCNATTLLSYFLSYSLTRSLLREYVPWRQNHTWQQYECEYRNFLSHGKKFLQTFETIIRNRKCAQDILLVYPSLNAILNCSLFCCSRSFVYSEMCISLLFKVYNHTYFSMK